MLSAICVWLRAVAHMRTSSIRPANPRSSFCDQLPMTTWFVGASAMPAVLAELAASAPLMYRSRSVPLYVAATCCQVSMKAW